MAASIKKNFILNLINNISKIIFPLITAPYVARVLSPDSLGLVGFSGTYSGYFVLFASLGSSIYCQRKIASLRDDKEGTETFMSEMLSILSLHTIVLLTIYVASIFLIPKFYANYIMFLIAGIGLGLYPLSFLSSYFNGRERFDFTVTRGLIISVISTACLFIFVKSERDVYIFALLSIITSVGVIGSNVFYLRKDKVKIKLTTKGLKKHYKPMLILFASNIAVSVYVMLDRFMLGLLTTYSEVAYYNYATTLSKSTLALVTSLSAVALPRIAYYFKSKDYEQIGSLLDKSFNVISFLAFPLMIGLMCMAPTFIPLFLGEAYIPAIVPTIILGFLIVAIGYNNILGIQIMIGMSMDKQFLKCVLVGTSSNFLLNLVLISPFGASGAAVASVIAETLILIVEIWYIQKHTPIRIFKNLSDIWKSLIGSLLFIPITMLLGNYFEGWFYVIAIIILCSLIYFVVQAILKNTALAMVTAMVKQKIKR